MYDVFFFSSRRRHTRWPRDWSSDVCSSDLAGRNIQIENHTTGESMFQYIPDHSPGRLLSTGQIGILLHGGTADSNGRSEERRGGKECKDRRWADREKLEKQLDDN